MTPCEIGWEQKESYMKNSVAPQGEVETPFVTDTYQFNDYSKYETSAFNAEAKKRRREEVFQSTAKKHLIWDINLLHGKIFSAYF